MQPELSLRGRIAGVLVLFAAVSLAVGLTLSEKPYGTISGVVVAEDTGKPLPRVHLDLTTREPNPEEYDMPLVVASIKTDKQGRFSQRVEAGMYYLLATTRAHKLKPVRVTVEEGRTTRLNLSLTPGKPFLQAIVHQHVNTPDKTAQVAVEGFVKPATLQVELYRTDEHKLLLEQHGDLGALLAPQRRSDQPHDIAGNPALTFIRRWEELITTRDAEGVFYQRLQIPLSGPGIYVVVVRGGETRAVDWVAQTNLALVTKTDGQTLLASVCDLTTGAPVPAANVTVYGNKGEISQGTTDAHGLLLLPAPNSENEGQRAVLATKNGYMAFLSAYVPSREGIPYRVYFQTDRPLYRPGHRVQFKGLVRKQQEEGYAVPSGERVEVEIRDPLNTLLYHKTITLNDYGSFYDVLDLDEEAATGSYEVKLRLAGREQYESFTVATYRKPEYEVKITPAQTRYVRGDKVQADVQATYYFGSPVPYAEVEYTILRSPYWFWLPEQEGGEADFGSDWNDEEGNFENWDNSGEVVAEGRTKTNADGAAQIRFGTGLPQEVQDQDYRYTIRVSVKDQSRRVVEQEQSVLVTRGEYKILLTPEAYLTAPGQLLTVKARVVDYDGKPQANVRVQAGLAKPEWDLKTDAERPTPSSEQLNPYTTDAKGEISFTVTPPHAGDYLALARVTDPRGNRISESVDVWVTSQAQPAAGHVRSGLQMVLDKRRYEPGDQASVLITSAEKADSVLVALEADRLYWYQLVPLVNKSAQVTLPVLPEYAPNVYVTASTVYKGERHDTLKRLNVSTAAHTLKVSVTSDKPQYRPGEQATYTVHTIGADGQPAAAEVALSVVDEALYAIAPDTAPAMLDFFYGRRSNSVVTDTSFPEMYLSADKATMPGAVRRYFPDTAYWNPTLLTDKNGLASFTLKMPDSLTTWRATARAATLDTAVGSATQKCLNRLPLSIRLEPPAFFTQGDHLKLAAIVHNDTGAPQRVTVRLEAPGLDVEGTTSRVISMNAAPQRLEWWVTANRVGSMKLTAGADAGQYQDAVELNVPCVPLGRVKETTPCGVLRERAEEVIPIEVRQDAVPGTTRLQVRLSPSLVSTAFGALGYLAQYPYGCVEQTTSVFLPNIALYQALRGTKQAAALPPDELPRMVNRGLLRLYNMARPGGGWGWWRYDDLDIWMTAYALQGLRAAQQAGFPINDTVYHDGLQALKTATTPELLHKQRIEPYERYEWTVKLAMAALTLAQGGEKQAAEGVLQYLRVQPLPTCALINCTRALKALGDDSGAAIMLGDLLGRARESDATLSWQENEPWLRADTELTALGLLALLEVNPHDERVNKALTYLATTRRGSGWVSTRDTAAVIQAIAVYVRQYPLPQAQYSASVELNGKLLQRVTLGPQSLTQPEVLIKVNPTELHTGTNQLVIRRDGAGELWYTCAFRQVLGGPEALAVPQTGSGIAVTREYHRIKPGHLLPQERMTLQPEPKARTRFQSGEIIEVKLRVSTNVQGYQQLVLEDPVPAGCEIMDRGDVDREDWDNWWTDMVVRDDRICFFLRDLKPGISVLTYHLRAQIPGQYNVLPSDLYVMYRPEIRAGGVADRLVISK